jgi:hypothetical protein
VQGVMPEHLALSLVDIWFQDEARVGQQGTLSRVWEMTGARPRLTRQLQYNYSYIFGAICPQKKQAVGLVLPIANTEGMQMHLDEISKYVEEGRHAVIVVDKATWHTTSKLNLPSNISLLPLPATAPELNPVEQVWNWIRQHCLSNRAFKDYEEIVDEACKAWNVFADQPNLIASIGERQWATL